MAFQINIPEPCHENWNKMSRTSKGKFCASCKKEVIDFTRLSKPVIQQKLKDSDNLCGRFTNNQLQVEYSEQNHSHSFFWKIALAIGISTLIPTTEVAQESQVIPSAIIQRDSVKAEVNQSNSETPVQDSIVIKGQVVDADLLEPIIAATIIIKNSDEGTVTDLDGNFTLRFEKKTKKEQILVSHLSYKPKEFEVSLQENHDLNTIHLDYEGAIMGDVVVITGMVAKNRLNLWQRFKNLFRSKEKHCTVE